MYLHAIAHFRLAEAVPVEGTASFAEISAESALDEREVRRIMRYAMMEGIFEEGGDGRVRHTAASRLLAEDCALQDWLDVTFKEVLPAKLNVSPARVSRSSTHISADCQCIGEMAGVKRISTQCEK